MQLNYIRLGYADVIVTGGSEAAVNESGIGGFNALHALSTRNDEYKTASRPYDVTRDGFVLGEGAGALILEDTNMPRLAALRYIVNSPEEVSLPTLITSLPHILTEWAPRP